MNHGVIATIAACAVAACSSGSTAPQRKSPPPRDAHARPGDASLANLDGAGLYRVLCAPCHGAEAKGYAADRAPSLVNPTFLESASDDFLRRSIELGRPNSSMAAYGKSQGGPLDAAQLDALVGFLRAQGPAAKPLPAAAHGDAKRGAPIYTDKCLKCHGTWTERGQYVSLANPRLNEIATDSFLRWAIVNGRPGTPMDAWQGKLNNAEIDDVVAYVRELGQGAPAVESMPAPTGTEPLVLNPEGKDPSFDLRADPCPPAGSGKPACKPDKRFVAADQVKRALDERRRLVIIDARPASEWMQSHIAGAVSIPYHDMKRLDELPKDPKLQPWVVAYCACPHHLSGVVVDELRKRGYAKSAVLDEGVLEWHRRNYPMVVAKGMPAPPADPRTTVGKPGVAAPTKPPPGAK